MADFELMKALHIPGPGKIVQLVLDGLGGVPRELDGKTELEAASTPHFDALAARSQLGLAVPVRPGVTPGSGPAHLSLFGYDPLTYDIGRGVLEALGIGFDLQPEDVAARGNFCTIDENGLITDRRAGRIPTELNRKLVALLRGIQLPGIQTFVEAVKEYRFVLVLRPSEGQTLQANILDTDPQRLGVPSLPARAQDEADPQQHLEEEDRRRDDVTAGQHHALEEARVGLEGPAEDRRGVLDRRLDEGHVLPVPEVEDVLADGLALAEELPLGRGEEKGADPAPRHEKGEPDAPGERSGARPLLLPPALRAHRRPGVQPGWPGCPGRAL